MSDTVRVECPQCEEDLSITSWTENHKVHNGIGMQTVARDHYTEIKDGDCNCDLSEEEMEDIFDRAAEKLASNKRYIPDGKF